MEDQVIQPDSTPAPPPSAQAQPRRGRPPGQPRKAPAVHHVPVPVEAMTKVNEVAELTGQKPEALAGGFRAFLAERAGGLAVEFAALALAQFEERLAAKKAELANGPKPAAEGAQ